ncbi:hypothetical protein, partial [Salmonella sp. s54836]|uniref:hypothetical protein n=1 Tax=Salmonella sp. s54836 TaxID=3159673 RepID=UPI00397EC29C
TMNNERWVLRHQPSDRANQQSPITLDLNSTSTCSSAYQCTISTETIEAWEIPPICGSPETTTIVAALGETGGKQGYAAITSRTGWGIAWYLNSSLIPEVYLLRNTKYTFLVHGGDNASLPAFYHPFYITDSSTGGIETRLQSNLSITETVYAGIVFLSNGQIASNVIGPY